MPLGSSALRDLLKKFGVQPNTLSMWKGRGVPRGELFCISRLLSRSAAWLETGEGEMLEGGREQRPQPGSLDKELVPVVIEAVEEGLGDLKLELKPDKKAQLVITLCEMLEEEKQVDKPTLLRLIKLAV